MPDEEAAVVARQQAGYITRVFREEKGITVRTEYGADGGIDCMYAEGQILVRDEYLPRVQRLLGQPVGPDRVKHVIDGVVLLSFGVAGDGADAAESAIRPLSVVDALQIIDGEIGVNIVSPNHVVTVTQQPPPNPGLACPATEPEEVYYRSEPYPGVCTDESGEGVLVYIADTGLLEDASSKHSWLAGVRRAQDSNGQLQDWDPALVKDAQGDYWIPYYAGHGTFVAGVVRCMAPKADVIVSKVFDAAGGALESDFVPELTRALTLGVDIFHLSVAAPTKNHLPLLAFERWLNLLRQYKGVVCVVAAGNDGSQLPCWPAAFPQTVSVGALAADWRSRADFSNYGGWVDVYAPGRDLVNAYATGRYKCEDFPYAGQVREFHGMAKWSGTSFSTPIVTGRIAARMWRTGENGQQAAAALLAEARGHAIPGVGAILLPYRDR